jgi:hypothetical protein
MYSTKPQNHKMATPLEPGQLAAKAHKEFVQSRIDHHSQTLKATIEDRSVQEEFMKRASRGHPYLEIAFYKYDQCEYVKKAVWGIRSHLGYSLRYNGARDMCVNCYPACSVSIEPM